MNTKLAEALHRRRISDELREIECPPDPDAVDRALDADALRADAEQAQEAQQPAGRASVDDWERELSAVMPADFKDWWQNSRREWPAVAAEVIKSLRRDRDAGWEVAARAQRREPLTDAQIEQGRRETFSTENPFCPCTDKTMRKAVRWAERACAEAWGVKLGATPGEQR